MKLIEYVFDGNEANDISEWFWEAVDELYDQNKILLDENNFPKAKFKIMIEVIDD